MIDKETEAHLVKAAQAGDGKAANALVEAHMPLIRSLARRHGRYLEEEDAVSNGVLGFLEGLPRFDVDSGYRVNTFIRHYITEGIRSANHNAPLVKLTRSKDMAGGLKAIADIVRTGDPVTVEALAAKTGYGTKTARKIIAKHAHTRSGVYRSMDDAMHIEDERPHPDQTIEMAQRRSLLEKAKASLNEKERYIFENRTAAREEVRTLEDIAQVYGVSKERIRQIEMRALEKIQKRLAMLGMPRVDLKAA